MTEAFPTQPMAEFLDGATPALDELSRDVHQLRETMTAGHLSLSERLALLEDIFESEVGDTPLVRARNLEREFGVRQLYLKFEGGNPTGAQKDRIACAQVMDALRRGYDTITVATCGNYGAAVALAAYIAGLGCLIFIPGDYHTRRVGEMTRFGARIARVSGDYERAVAESRERAARDDLYDANPGGANSGLQLKAYGEIAYEIYDELRDAPAAVAVPVSNGTTLAGIHRGFQSLHRRGKSSRMPRLVGGSSHGKNPVVQAFLKKLARCRDLVPETIRETRVNEPLINWHAIDGDEALTAIRATGGWADNVSDRKMLAFSRRLREMEGLHVLPASTAGLVALLERHQTQPLTNDRFVAVLTGRKQ